MLVKLTFDCKLRRVESVDRNEPPKNICIPKHIYQFLKVCLSLKLDQLFVFNLFMQLVFDVKVSLSPFEIIYKASILINLNTHVEDPAEAKEAHPECEKPVESCQNKIEPVKAS